MEYFVSRNIARRPLLTTVKQQLDKIPGLRRVYQDLDIFLKYRAFRPERVPLKNSHHCIYVNPLEPRARSILRDRGGSQPDLKQLWCSALATLEPSIVLDIGANYGEFVFLQEYSPGTRVLAVEANPELQDYLERSRAEHPNAGDIELVCALAADNDESLRTFYVDATWSGRSSAVKTPRQGLLRSYDVPCRRIDSLVADESLATAVVLFKIDVEGYEPVVLAGMQETLGRCKAAFGLVEFNIRFLERLGIDPDTYLEELSERFHLFSITRAGSATKLAAIQPTTAALASTETDIVLTTDPTLAQRVVEGYGTARGSAKDLSHFPSRLP